MFVFHLFISSMRFISKKVSHTNVRVWVFRKVNTHLYEWKGKSLLSINCNLYAACPKKVKFMYSSKTGAYFVLRCCFCIHWRESVINFPVILPFMIGAWMCPYDCGKMLKVSKLLHFVWTKSKVSDCSPSTSLLL